MKGGTQTALALGVGYVLGRRRKMRMTTILAVGAATGGLGGLGGAAVKRGMKMLGSTEMLGKVAPQLGEIADTVRGDLLGAGKEAAVAAASNRIGSLTDSLHDRAQRIREPAGALTEQTAGRIPRQRRNATSDEESGASRGEPREPEDLDGADTDEADTDEADTDEAGQNGRRAAPSRRRTARPGSAVTRTRTAAGSRTRR